MKNKKKYIYIFVLIMIILAIICFVLIINSNSVEKNIKNKKWYNYNKETATYNVLEIKNHKLTLLMDNEDFSKCTRYRYNSTDKSLIMNCEEKIIINEYKENYLVLSINDKEMKFYTTTDETLNYEFEKFYEKSILEFKNERKQILQLLKIDYNNIPEDENLIIVFNNDMCNNIECVLIMDILEKWHVESNNVYIISLNDINKNELNEINNKFNINLKIDNNYPYILTKSNENYNFEEFKCNDLYCSNWRNHIKKTNGN